MHNILVNGKDLLRTVEADVEIGIIVSTEQYEEWRCAIYQQERIPLSL